MPNLLRRLKISSVDLCKRGANPLARIALSKSEDDTDVRARLAELAKSDMPLAELADELRALGEKMTRADGESEELMRQREAETAHKYAAICDEKALTDRLMKLRAAGGDVYEEYVNMLDELAEAKRVEPLMKEYGTARTPGGALEARVAEIMRAEPGLSRAQAVVRAYQSDPDIPEVL